MSRSKEPPEGILAGRPEVTRDRGDPDTALIAFVGSSPRSAEVKANRAFTGEGPGVLRQVLSTLGVPLEACWFTHAVPRQTPRARAASAEEVDYFEPLLRRRVRASSAKVVVAMGADAIRAVSGASSAPQTVRGHVTNYANRPAMLTIDPHRVVRANPRFARGDAIHESGGSPEAFPDLVVDLERVVRYALHDEPLQVPLDTERYFLARTPDAVDRVLRRIERLPVDTPVAVDIESSGLDYRTDRILTIGMSWRAGTGAGIEWAVMDRRQLERLGAALSRLRLVFHNGAFDVPWLRAAGLPVSWDADTMLLHYLTDERPGTHGLERLAIDRYSWEPYETALKQKYKVGSAAASDAEASYENVPMDALLLYNVADCDVTLRLYQDLLPEVENEGLLHLHDDLLIPAAEHFLRLERDGMLVDRDYLEELGSSWRREMEELERTMRSYPGAEEINLRSTAQIARYLYDVLELEQMPGQEGGYVDPDKVLELTDAVEDDDAQEYFRMAASSIFMSLKPRSTATYMLWWLADQHEWPKALVQYRLLGTRYRTYYEGTLNRLHEGRIRPRFRLHGTRTGRLSSTDPNIHGIPRSKEIKNIFVADPGYTLIAADYSQAEVRMMAHFARDRRLIEALQEADIHRAISRTLFGVTEEEMSRMDGERIALMRRAAKTIIFGLIYGRSAKSLAPQLGVSLEETEEYIRELFRMMPDVPRFIQRQQNRVLREQEAVSLFGRKRRFPLILRSGAAQVRRQGVNMPIQSTVSDMTLMANLRVIAELDRRGVAPKVWPHIHDGFLFQVPDEHVEEAVELTREVMGNPPFETDVFFASEIEVGKRWGSMEEV